MANLSDEDLLAAIRAEWEAQIAAMNPRPDQDYVQEIRRVRTRLAASRALAEARRRIAEQPGPAD